MAAHFAITDPRTEDSAADLAASVIFPLSVDDGHLATGGIALTVEDGSTSRSDLRWSLTQNFEELVKRYPPLR